MAQGHESRRINEEPSMAAPDFSCTLADQTVMEGLRVVLSCCGKGDPQPNMTWYHQGHEVVSNQRVTFMQDGENLSLVLQSALLSDQGCFQCVLCNCAGKASCQGHLQVIAAVPIPIEDAPLVEKVTCEAIVLSWKPPKIFMALTAGITYAVQYQADGQGPWIVLASRVVATSYTAPSLSPGSHYRFRILLVTPQGCSSPSPPSTPCLLPGNKVEPPHSSGNGAKKRGASHWSLIPPRVYILPFPSRLPPPKPIPTSSPLLAPPSSSLAPPSFSGMYGDTW
uniref:Uncharacterized protein n=1 Tax=Eptatretus burgeri TaxID=7764 RepID=A0A8C4N3F8_EPTBU